MTDITSATSVTTGPTTDAVRAALATVPYPGLTRDLVSLGMVDHVSACGNRVQVRLALRTTDPDVPARLEQAITTRSCATSA